jgi:hypothetical protein
MSELDKYFKHKINSTVKFTYRLNDKPTVMHIVSRELEECPGGIQYHYYCRQHTEDGYGTQLVKFNEVELEACDLKKDLEEYEAKEHEKRLANDKEFAKIRAEAMQAAKDRKNNS